MVERNNQDAAELAQSLQHQIEMAKGLGLDFAARLLAMALIELKTELHGISPEDIEALCRQIEERAAPRVMHESAQVIPFPGRTRRRRRSRV